MKRIKLSSRLKDLEGMKRCELDQCGGACCVYGAWVDEGKMEEILSQAMDIIPHMKEDHRKPEEWFDGRKEEDEHVSSGMVVHTRVVEDLSHYGGTACVFLRADAKCALQVASETLGKHPWHLKPFYCILHPLDLDEEGRITLDKTEELVGEEASCLRPIQGKTALKTIFKEELEYLRNHQ